MERKRIIDAYRNGDEDKRLSFFLGYRELRDEFTRIESDSEPVRHVETRGPKWLKRIAGFL